jgi:hypothetical protein
MSIGGVNSTHTREGVTLAEIERRLRAVGYSQEAIDTTLMVVVTHREHLARTGTCPLPKREYVS